MNVKTEKIVVQAKKRTLGSEWTFEVSQPLKATHGIDVERAIECQLSPVISPMKYKRMDDERGILRRLFG